MNWNIWLKGDVPPGQGHSGVCDLIEHQLMGIAEADTFEEAVRLFGEWQNEKWRNDPRYDGIDYYKGATYWGYPLQPEEPNG